MIKIERCFNITGACNPEKHYMVDLKSRLVQVKEMVDKGKYFVINRGRQYGKTTLLKAVKKYLEDEYIIIDMDFQMQMSSATFLNEQSFVEAFSEAFIEILEFSDNKDLYEKNKNAFEGVTNMVRLFKKISRICRSASKPVILMIDEVDQASNNQVFLDFLAQLRGYYLNRTELSTFHSVILAGVHDIRNLKGKIRPDEDHKHNSPWNISSSFEVDMNFSSKDIEGMLTEYEKEHHTGMDIVKISEQIYNYTSGYPVLVSMFCYLMDGYHKWDTEGILEASKEILVKQLPLFDTLINKLEDNEKLSTFIHNLLFNGKSLPYNVDDSAINQASMYGFIKNKDGVAVIANRIFEVRIYNWYISMEATENSIFAEGTNDKNQFITSGNLDMERVIEKFAVHFREIYGDRPEKFIESEGRKLFLLYLRPIINGVGNYYIEAQTRDMRRTDVIVDYSGKQYIIELKIWRGEEYNTSGEQQLSEYLEYYNIDKGYLVSFNFNKNKHTGLRTIELNGKTIVEATI